MKLGKLSPEVLADLQEIWIYIAKDNPEAANKLEEDLLQGFRILAVNPNLGHTRSALTDKPVRFWLIRRQYLIVYRVRNEMLEIIRVFHGARDIAAEL